MSLRGRGRRFGLVDVDDDELVVRLAEGLPDKAAELPFDEENPGAAVIEGERDVRGVEPRIERIEHRAQHRRRVQRLDERWDVGRQDRHRVEPACAELRESARQAHAPVEQVRVGGAALPVDDGDLVRKGGGCAGQETDRRQRNEVGLVRVQICSQCVPILCGHDFRPVAAKVKIAPAHDPRSSAVTALFSRREWNDPSTRPGSSCTARS